MNILEEFQNQPNQAPKKHERAIENTTLMRKEQIGVTGVVAFGANSCQSTPDHHWIRVGSL